MAKTRLGFDIGNNSVKIAAVTGEKMRVYEIRMPDNMIQDGEILMPNAFSEFLKKEMKRLKIPRGECALVLPSRQVICRAVTLPRMTKDQLLLNLPYEFSEFIQGDPDRFICDYAMCDPEPGQSGEEEQLTMMAAAAGKERVQQYIRMFSGAGLKLRTLLPGEMALIRLVERYRAAQPDRPEEYCFVNLGHDSIGVTIIQKDRVRATRQIEFGCGQMDLAIADLFNTDPFLAGSYKLTNYQDVCNSPECMEIYQRIAVELLRVLHFYRFNYRDTGLGGIYLVGGGACIQPLRRRLEEMLEEDMMELPFLPVEEFLAGGLDEISAAQGIFAAGVAVA